MAQAIGAGGAETSGTYSPSSSNPVDQAITQANYNAYVSQGGDPSSFSVGPNGVFTSGSPTSPNAASPYGPYGSSGSAAYNVGDGKTRWDEFVQQMQLEQDKLTQAKQLQEEQLAQQKALEEERLAEQQRIADQNTVEAYDKELMGMQGPKDPYGYLFASRGLAAPQGYSPTPMALPDAVANQYKNEGINLQQAQQSVSGSSGPSFIQGYLGSVPNSLQQGPMGFQNSSQFKDLAPGSAQSQQAQQSLNQVPGQPQTPSPVHAAQGMVVPGYAPGQDTVPAVLSPGEGVLKPQVVQAMGGPSAINALNAQHFADGGVVNATMTPSLPQTGYNQLSSWLSAGRPDVMQGIQQGRDNDVLGQYLKEAYGGDSSSNATSFLQSLAAPGPTTGVENQLQTWLSQPNRPDIQQAIQQGRMMDVLGQYLKETGSFDPTGWNQLFAGLGQTPPTPPNTYSLAGTSVGAGSYSNAPPSGYNLTSPGVAQYSGGLTNGPTGIASYPAAQTTNSTTMGGLASFYPTIQATSPTGTSSSSTGTSGTGIASAAQSNMPSLPAQGGSFGSQPIGSQPTQRPSDTFNQLLPGSSVSSTPGQTPPPGNPSAPVLTGGIVNAVGPANGSPMNLNMLDPYTRSLVDQYGRPQIPSAQALANMPQSGVQAFQNYVNTVAGGNYQDLIDQSKMMDPNGATPTDFTFS